MNKKPIKEENFYSSIQEVNIEEVSDIKKEQKKKPVFLPDYKFELLDL